MADSFMDLCYDMWRKDAGLRSACRSHSYLKEKLCVQREDIELVQALPLSAVPHNLVCVFCVMQLSRSPMYIALPRVLFISSGLDFLDVGIIFCLLNQSQDLGYCTRLLECYLRKMQSRPLKTVTQRAVIPLPTNSGSELGFSLSALLYVKTHILVFEECFADGKSIRRYFYNI